MRLCLGRPLALSVVVSAGFGIAASAQQAIDRRALVDRHAPVLRGFDTGSPLSVGNGEFAFTVDATGLQTFAEAYDEGVPLGTLSQWAWHTDPNPNGYAIDRFRLAPFESHGRQIGYADVPGDQRTPEVEWLRRNPHRLHLGRIGFRLLLKDGREATAEDLKDVEQRLELWDGTLLTRFRLDGEEVMVETLCHPTRDAIGVRVVSPLVGRGQIGIRLRFPYGSGEKPAADWTRPQAHQTKLVRSTSRNALFERELDHDRYRVSLAWSVEGAPQAERRARLPADARGQGRHARPAGRLLPGVRRARCPRSRRSAGSRGSHWNEFWTLGGAVDLSQSRDPRWRELERRIVLSQYLTAIQCAGRYPPQETGLTFNSWYGKFHLEMHWWHAAQFALWGRPRCSSAASATTRASCRARRRRRASQGYAGARWPKMTDPSGRESPSSIGPFLVWQQPHPIYFAELVYRAQPDGRRSSATARSSFETAEFMASLRRTGTRRRRLRARSAAAVRAGDVPQGEHDQPPFELAYWRWGLETAQRWRERLGVPREPRWEGGVERLSPPPSRDGRYLFAETRARELQRPALGARPPVGPRPPSASCPGRASIPRRCAARFDWIWDHWSWPDTWGWDYPMLAMTAAARSASPSARSTRS